VSRQVRVPRVPFPADLKALLESLTRGEERTEPVMLPNWEEIAARADLDDDERLVLKFKLRGISRERAISEEESEAEREKIAAAWQRFERMGARKLRLAASEEKT
jgi:hypothetical protein